MRASSSADRSLCSNRTFSSPISLLASARLRDHASARGEIGQLAHQLGRVADAFSERGNCGLADRAHKRSVAQWIHANSNRRAGPLVRADAAAVFRRARDPAHGDVLADIAGGMLALDEVCDLSNEAQAPLAGDAAAPIPVLRHGRHGEADGPVKIASENAIAMAVSTQLSSLLVAPAP
jgi:hypothetical protein